jgi:putative ABC transport system permease protein
MIGPPVITYFDLLMASSLIVLAALLSLILSLGLTRNLLVGALRSLVQLTLLGLALKWIFALKNPYIILTFVAAMLLIAAHTALKRVKNAPPKAYPLALLSLTIPAIVVTLTVTSVVMGIDPWYDPRYLLPICGMVVGNSLSAVAVALDRLFSLLRSQKAEITALLALGALPSEAAAKPVREALRAGMIPTLNAMSAAGVVFIPGMMTGQILSGTDPMLAAKYQIVVFLMVCAATAISSVLAVVLGYRRGFDARARFIL